MPVIIAFGDSNTWGYDPATGGRFPHAQRWPSVLQRELGPDFEVIAEGLNGHTTVHDDPIESYRCGADALPPCLMSHAPLDLVILGTPSALHAEQGIAAAHHGLHVLTEKPIDIATKKADALIAAADQAKRKSDQRSRCQSQHALHHGDH